MKAWKELRGFGGCRGVVCWSCTLSHDLDTWIGGPHAPVSSYTHRCITTHIHYPRSGSSVVEHLVYIQKTWVQTPVWSLLHTWRFSSPILCGAPWLAGGILGCSWVFRCVLCRRGSLGRRRIHCPGFEEGEVVVALQHRADRAVVYVCACLWLWCIARYG